MVPAPAAGIHPCLRLEASWAGEHPEVQAAEDPADLADPVDPEAWERAWFGLPVQEVEAREDQAAEDQAGRREVEEAADRAAWGPRWVVEARARSSFSRYPVQAEAAVPNPPAEAVEEGHPPQRAGEAGEVHRDAIQPVPVLLREDQEDQEGQEGRAEPEVPVARPFREAEAGEVHHPAWAGEAAPHRKRAA